MLSLANTLFAADTRVPIMPLETKGEGNQTPEEMAPIWEIPATLQQLADSGHTELVEELVAEFQADSAERLALICLALPGADYPTIHLEAHTIKGSAMQVGANRMADLCYRLELAARGSAPGDLGPLVDAVLHSFEEVRGVLASRRGPSPPGKPATEGPSFHGE
jgi:HPt (histidine-containing phosphotransfer) domain-containing protein